MKISDLTCAHCGALYMLAESVSVDGSLDGPAGDGDCKICGNTLADQSSGKLRAFRLVMSRTARALASTASP